MLNAISQRNEDLYDAVMMQLRGGASLNDALHAAADGPAPSFYVDTLTAQRVVGAMLRGNTPIERNKRRRRQWHDLLALLQSARQRHPDDDWRDLLTRIVLRHPAPSFYISFSSARAAYAEMRRRYKPANL